MSYCRFSSDNGYSDVYVYPSTGGGYVTHVAARRPPPGAPPDGMALLFGSKQDGVVEEFDRLAEIRRAWDAENPHVSIDHPEAGAGFVHDTPGECADNLERLRAEGFHVPQGAIDALRAEQKETSE